MKPETLDARGLGAACAELAARDAELRFIYETYGRPPLWARAPSFATLVHIILEQQVSLAAARAAFDKLRARLGAVTPARLLALTDEELRECYFSRQKTRYARELARAVESGALDPEGLTGTPDAEVRAALKRITGIGDWTADIFLLMALRRPDVMPRGDLALHAACRRLYRLETAPTSAEFQLLAERWRPFRAVAARLLWHFYLSEKSSSSGRKTAVSPNASE